MNSIRLFMLLQVAFKAQKKPDPMDDDWKYLYRVGYISNVAEITVQGMEYISHILEKLIKE